MKKICKSITAVLLATLMFFSLPTSIYAYIGAAVTNTSGITSGRFKQDSETYAFIQNEFIHFDVCIESTNYAARSFLLGSHAHTIPTATFNQNKLDYFGVQNISILKAPMKSMDAKTESFEAGVYQRMQVTRVNARFDVDDRFPMYDGEENPATYHGDLALDYWLGNDTGTYVVHTYFNLVQLNDGSHSAADMDYVYVDDGDTSVNWGVLCTTYVESNKVFRTITDKNGELSYSYNNDNNTFFRVDMEYVNFAKTGHDTITINQLKDIAVNAETRSESGLLSQTVISNGVSTTSPNAVTEVYCDSYSTAAPFVACSNYYYYSLAGGVEGHESHYAESVEFADNTLKTHSPGLWAFTQKDIEYIHDHKEERLTKYPNEFSSLWGYRHLMVEEEIQQQEIQPDKFDIHGSAQYLCVFPDGVDGNGKNLYTVKTAADANAIKALEATYGKSVAQYRGDYTVETDNNGNVKYYKFISGVAALSSSITATWNAVNSYFRLKPDGTLEFDQNAVSLNSPTFKFYDPKDGGGLTFDGYDSTKGLKFGIKPDKNNACINISLPGNSVQVKGASIDTKGNLVFTGKFKMNLFVAQMEMLKLGYGLDSKSNFVCNGVHAKGSLKVPKAPGKDKDDDEEAKPNVLGFGGASMKGEVNTFPGEEIYAFEFELTVKNLFSTKAELTLVRLKNGRLCPEHLYFELKAEAEGAGIDLTPGTPVVTITGGGGGIDGLASTIDGNYTCIPPVVLTLVTYGQVIKVVDGKLTAKIGPSILKLSGEDLGFKVGNSNLEIVDSMYAGIYLTGKEITYGNAAKSIPTKTYRGVTFGGSLGIGIKIFNFKDDKDPLAKTLKFFNNTISASASLGLETYAGGATDGSNWMYMYIGSYGNASCSLNIPAGVPAIGGKKLLGAALDFKIGAQTAFPTGEGSNSAKLFFKNASLTGGIAATGYVWPVYGRVVYVLPDKVKLTGKLFSELDPVNWDDILVDSSNNNNSGNRTVALSDPEVVETEDGEQAIAYVQANITSLKTRLLTSGAKNGTYSKTVSASTADVEEDEHIVFAVVPKNVEDIGTLESTITCDKISQFNWVPDEIDAAETNPDYNIWRSTYTAEEDGTVTSEAIYISLTKAQAAENNSKTVITAGVDFDITGLATTPVTGLTKVGINDSTLSATIVNPEDGKNYALYTYFGTKTYDEQGNEKQITTDYAVECRDITNTAGEQAVVLNASGNVAPTGDYYVTTALVERTQVTVQNEDGTTEDIDADIPVASWVSQDTYHYVNTTVPNAPQDVNLELIGNESMKGSWKKVDNADGYKVTIYQEEDGKFIDTERGYNLTNDDFTATQGLAYDEATQTYSIEMAMTVGGDGNASTITSSEGEEVEISAEAAKEISALEAGKRYKIGVQAYKTNSIQIDDEVSTYDEYSDEEESDPLLLPVYKPVTFDVTVAGEAVTADENGIFNASVNGDDYAVYLSSAKDGENDVTADTVFTVSQIGLTDDEGNDYSVPLDIVADNTFRIPTFDGTIALEISAKYSHDNIVDETLAYLYVNKDNVAPVITLDEETLLAEENGDYTVTGMTEPGVKVKLALTKSVRCKDSYTDENGKEQTHEWIEQQDKEYEVTAGKDGAFSFTDNLGLDSSAVVTARATDKLGNESDNVSTIVSGRIDLSKAKITGLVTKTYTGKAITQDIVVTLGSEIVPETAYTVAYKNNVKPGTATVTVTGKNNYFGKASATFKVDKIDISGAVISGLTAKTYNGKKQTQKITVKLNGKVLGATFYTVSYANNVNAGNASVIVTGTGNYKGSVTANFKINKVNLSKATVKGIKTKTYNGKKQTQKISVILNGKTLGADAYKVSYAKNVNAGKATLTVAGAKNYSGKVTKNFTVAKAKNPITAKAKKPKVNASKLSSKAQSIAAKKAVTVSKAKGKVTYKLAKKNKKITVNKKNGKITLSKGLKPGTYAVKIKVTAAGNKNYKKGTKSVTVKIQVK